MKFAFASSMVVADARGVSLGPYPGYTGDLKVAGEVNAYLAESGNAYLTFNLKGLEDACKATPEGVANACGIHIHEGKTCDDADSVGGHYYATDSDPWGVLGYNTKYGGRASGSVKAAIGQGEDIAGRAIVVHDSTGGRVACALAPAKLEVKRGVQLGPYPGYAGDLEVSGEVNAYLAESGNAYLTFNLKGLEDACKTTPDGVANACGIHIHEGKTCDDADSVGGHYYSTDSDPWGVLGYNTKYGGRAYGSVKAAIGQGQDIAGRAIVVHDSTGGRVACALAPAKLEVKRGVQLGPYPGYTGDLKVAGEVNAYLAESGNAYLTYNLKGLEDACKTTPEGVGNACGIHIHEGKTCDDADSVGGHYYSTDSDPWGVLGYNTKYGGRASGSVKAAIGQGEDIAGRAIVVHDSTGGRVACALAPAKLEVMAAQCDTDCRDLCNQPYVAGGPGCCAACGCPEGDCPAPAKLEVMAAQCDTDCRDLCNQPYVAGGPGCCAACGCPEGDCPAPGIAV